MEETIFNADQANATNTPASTEGVPSTPTFTIPTEVVDLVGEGKKYKSPEDALKSVPHAQKHISTLEEENRKLKDELIKRKAAEDVLNEIKQSAFQQQQTTPGGVEADPDVLSQIVEQVLEKKTLVTQQQTNASIVTSKFTETYGTKAEETYNDLAKRHGMSVLQLNQLALTSPAAVLALAGLHTSNNGTNSGKLTSSVVTPPSQGKGEPSAKLPRYATTKDVTAAFQASRQKVLNNLNKG